MKQGNPTLRYEDVHWYRRSWFNSWIAFGGLLLFPPLLWWCCINLITGDVYYNSYDKEGNLRKWSNANKVVAFILLAVNLLYVIWIIVAVVS